MEQEKKDPVRWVEWGVFEVGGERHGKTEAGKVGVGKEIRVVGLVVTEWKERRGHTLTPSMITGIYGKGVHTLGIGLGVEGPFDCPDRVVRAIREHGIAAVICQRTPDARHTHCQLLRRHVHAAPLPHATC